jgi:hypothetical protein
MHAGSGLNFMCTRLQCIYVERLGRKEKKKSKGFDGNIIRHTKLCEMCCTHTKRRLSLILW